MSKNLLLSAVVGLSSLTASTTVEAQNTALISRVKAEASKTPKQVSPLRRVAIDPTQYGQIVTILEEDFSKLTTGSIDAPDLQAEIAAYDWSEYPAWISVLSEYTHMPNWGGHFIYPAGGVLAMVPSEQGANLNTPMLNVNDHDNIAFFSFKARTAKEGETGHLFIEAAETFNMKPTWRILEHSLIQDINHEWKTYTFMFTKTGTHTIFHMVNQQMRQGEELASIFIDDVKVFQVKPNVHVPKVYAHKDYTGTSFQASWSKVAEADSYLLDVYSLQNDKDPSSDRTYLMKDDAINDTTALVDGIENGKTYYYTVRAKKGNNTSFESETVEVYDLVNPELSVSPISAEGKYTVNITPVPTAEVYNYWAYYAREAQQDGEFVITKEDYSEIDLPEGFDTSENDYKNWEEKSIDDQIYQSFDNYVINPANQAGWIAKQGVPYTQGYIAVDGWQYINNRNDACFISPELDLSKDNGKITIKANLYGKSTTVWFDDGTNEERTVRCAVALFNWDDNKNDFVQSELVYINDLDQSFQEKTVTLTKGTERSIIGLFAVYAPAMMYMKDLQITQNYKKGEVFNDPFLYRRYKPDTQFEVTIPAKASLANITHTATAVKTHATSRKQAVSKKNNKSFVGTAPKLVTDGLKEVRFTDAPVKVEDGNIVVTTTEPVSIYTVDGSMLFNSNSGNVSVPITNGTYIVKVGNNSIKVVY